MTDINHAKILGVTIDLVQGDITQQATDAIVNAANSALSGGGGVDGAIHWAAGSDLLKECRTLGRCPTGEARITAGYNLLAKHVIHAVGPVYQQYDDPSSLLASAHTNSLQLAQDNHLKTIAFPAISTGIYGYPLDEAAPIVLESVITFIKKHQPDFELVRFVLFDNRALQVFQKALAQLAETDNLLTID